MLNTQFNIRCTMLLARYLPIAKGSKQHKKSKERESRENCWLFKECYFFLIKCHMNLELLSNKRSGVPLQIYNSSVPHSQLDLKREVPSINCRYARKETCTPSRRRLSPDKITRTRLKFTPQPNPFPPTHTARSKSLTRMQSRWLALP